MKQLGMLLLAAALAAAAWWWFNEEMPRRQHARAAAAEMAAIQAERANSLYRWRDAGGSLQITDQPPKDRPYQRVSKTPKDGIEVRGSRD